MDEWMSQRSETGGESTRGDNAEAERVALMDEVLDSSDALHLIDSLDLHTEVGEVGNVLDQPLLSLGRTNTKNQNGYVIRR